ncbi:MAG: hypothetical protein LQ338_000710 [Usnochroma carphineum]|nr:MAG: hypothetical protein LQ338_000710 [Usnochroma carphineum]
MDGLPEATDRPADIRCPANGHKTLVMRLPGGLAVAAGAVLSKSRGRYPPVEFDPLEPDDVMENMSNEARSPRRPSAKARIAEPEDQEEIVFSGRSGNGPLATAQHGAGSPVEFDPMEPDPPEDTDGQMRQAVSASLMEPQAALRSAEDDYEEQLRKALEASTMEASAQRHPPSYTDEDEDYRRIMEESQKEHEAQQRKKARKEAELARRQEEELERALKASERAHRESGHQDEEEELARILSLSEAAHAEDVRRRAERMTRERATSRTSASYTESLAGRQGNSSEAASSLTSPTAPAEGTSEPAVKTPKPKTGILRSITGSLSSTSRKPSTKGKKKPKPSPLNPVPENETASSSTSAAAATNTTSTTASPTAITQLQKPTNSQALIPSQPPPRPPPIDPSALLALCEKAFPRDPGISAALAASKQSSSIYTVQQGADSDPELAAAIALSQEDHQQKGDEDEGLDDPPPEYHSSSADRILNHMKYTSSDYRREQPGYRKPLTADIMEIMRLYRGFLAWEKDAQPGPLDLTNDKDKGKAKESPPALPVPPSTDAPPEISDSLDETVRPALREELAIARPTAATTTFMAAQLPARAQTLARRMQAQSTAISQSRLNGYRPRREPEAHMRAFGRLPIMREEVEEEEAGRGGGGSGGGGGGGGSRRRDPGYRRSGI